MEKVILTGDRPTGKLHIGHYVGSLRRRVELQNSGEFDKILESRGAITNAATDSGLKVPEDVEVLSIIGTKYANITRPTLSTMNINMQDVGRRAMYMLVDLSKNALENKVYRIEPEYKKRQSTEE